MKTSISRVLSLLLPFSDCSYANMTDRNMHMHMHAHLQKIQTDKTKVLKEIKHLWMLKLTLKTFEESNF